MGIKRNSNGPEEGSPSTRLFEECVFFNERRGLTPNLSASLQRKLLIPFPLQTA